MIYGFTLCAALCQADAVCCHSHEHYTMDIEYVSTAHVCFKILGNLYQYECGLDYRGIKQDRRKLDNVDNCMDYIQDSHTYCNPRCVELQWSFHVLLVCVTYEDNWGLCCLKQVSQTGISNFIPQNTVGCNYLSLPEIPASGNKVHNCVDPVCMLYVSKALSTQINWLQNGIGSWWNLAKTKLSYW